MTGTAELQVESYGHLADGREVRLFTLESARGIRARVCDYGAILVSLEVPGRRGELADVTLGFDTLAGWLGNGPYFGATIGRFGNRIAHGRFVLGGRAYQLATNSSSGGIPCHLHGGTEGFDKKLWDAEVLDSASVRFRRISPDGEEGYPGTLSTEVTYTLTDEGELIWDAVATTDAPTPVNLVHHTYWNLSGNPGASIRGHELQIEARHYLPKNPGMIPTGELIPVRGTPLDFTEPRLIGERIDDPLTTLVESRGYDHCWVIAGDEGVRRAAVLRDPSSGRRMEVLTNQPGIQVYTGNFLEGGPGKGGVPFLPHHGVCLETQAFPDAPNHPEFPSCILLPGQTYHHVLIHRFSAD